MRHWFKSKRHCEEAQTTKQSRTLSSIRLDCFASLAMTLATEIE